MATRAHAHYRSWDKVRRATFFTGVRWLVVGCAALYALSTFVI